MIRVHESAIPTHKTFVEAIELAACQAPPINNEVAQARKLTDAEKLTVRREHAKGAAVSTLAKRFGVSEGQIRNCVA